MSAGSLSNSGEIFGVSLFAKHFTRPSSAVRSGSGGTSYVFFTNAQGGDNIGVEFEARKSFGWHQ